MFKKIFLSIAVAGTLIAEIPYSLEGLLNYQQTSRGFHTNDFWDAMQWGRKETAKEFYIDKDVIAVKATFDRFCSNLKSPSEQIFIPQIIHLIWLGSEIPEKVASCFSSWEKYHAHWKIKVWTDKEIHGFEWSCEHSKRCFEQADTWAEKADIVRLEVLYRFGGIYSDADVVCLNSFEMLTRQDIGFFSCFELNYIGKHYGEPFFVGSAVMGSCKESKVIKHCIDHLRSKAEAPDEGIIKRTGPGLISRACQMALATDCENILILPCSYFYPLPWKNRETTTSEVLEYVSPDTLAIHLWDGSWCNNKKEITPMRIDEAAIKIQSAFRGYSVRRYLISKNEKRGATKLISDTMKLNSLPTAACGISTVYVPVDLPLVLKKLGCKNAKRRFLANWHASHLCREARYTHLIVPRAICYKDFTIEEKQPVLRVTLWSQTALYLENLSLFSHVAKEFIGFLLKTCLDDILTPTHPYQDANNLLLGRSDNIPFLIDRGEGKVALIDLGNYTSRKNPPSHDEIKKCVRIAITIFPHHLKEICEVGKIERSDFEELSHQTKALFQKICLGKEILRQPVVSREPLEKELIYQLEQAKIIYYNFYKNRNNQLMLIIHK
ncbi:MAG: hypothetical protein LVR00_07855 [Rhabdochlamydiaceae bacterium]|jgi:mannosyltransferase OCH1-like enzyme